MTSTFFATINVPIQARDEREAATILDILVSNQTNLGADGMTRTFDASVAVADRIHDDEEGGYWPNESGRVGAGR